MSKLSIPTILAALCGSVFLTACPGDDTTGTGTETESSSSSSTGPVITTVPTTMTTTSDDTTTTAADTTVGVEDTTAGTTTTGESTTTTGESTESSSTGEPPPPMVGYGDCGNNDDAVACLPEETCIGAPLGSAVCLEVGCMDVGDCAVPTSGTAVATCDQLFGDPKVLECYLSCEMGETCPDGMSCTLDLACVWDLLPGVCPDQDLGNAVPQSVMDDNGGLGNDHNTSCGDGGGADAMYMFTATAAGNYTFDTTGSAIDTILSVLDDCGGMELDCNDDGPVGLTSELTIMLAAGQSVIIVVEGYGGEEGAITLNVSM